MLQLWGLLQSYLGTKAKPLLTIKGPVVTGLNETHEIFDAIDAIIVWWDVSHKDGMVDLHDLVTAAPLLLKAYGALKGLDKIPEELKSASAEDCQALAQKGVDLMVTALRTFLGDRLPK